MLNRFLNWIVGIQPMPVEVDVPDFDPEVEAALAEFATMFVRDGEHYGKGI